MNLKSSILVALLFILSAGNAFAQSQHLIIGVAPGPYGDLVKQAIAPSLAQKGYTIEVKEFSDYVQPNLALSNKAIHANLFQHPIYLTKFSADKGLKLSSLISVPTAGVGIYSKKYKSLSEIKEGATVTVPNDPTNLARALSYLQTRGLIKIKAELDATKASEKDIVENPKNLNSTLLKRHKFLARLIALTSPLQLAILPFHRVSTQVRWIERLSQKITLTSLR